MPAPAPPASPFRALRMSYAASAGMLISVRCPFFRRQVHFWAADLVKVVGPELIRARWGMPSPPGVLRTARDPGVTNARNLASAHWQRWLGPEHRSLVPVTAFAEPIKGGNQWFRAADPSVMMFFAGIETRGWRSGRKVKDGETEDDLFAFLTCPPNAEVQPIHPKAMPVILTQPEE